MSTDTIDAAAAAHLADLGDADHEIRLGGQVFARLGAPRYRETGEWYAREDHSSWWKRCSHVEETLLDEIARLGRQVRLIAPDHD